MRDRILQRLQSQSSGRNISVTDLVNVRQAYWRRVRPDVKFDMERTADMLAGSGFHDAFNWKVSSEEWIEQTVVFQDIVGRIDIYEEIPLELKTTKSLIEPDEIGAMRPSYVEQLGLYCAMVEKPDGHILIYNRGEGRPLVGTTVHFENLKGIQKEMLARRDLLRKALESGNPSTLPPCSWKGRGCVYDGVCDCGIEDATYPIAAFAEIKADQALEEEFAKRFNDAPSPEPDGIRINDLVVPRQAFYKTMKEDEEADLSESLVALEKQAMMRELKYRGLGASGELTSKPVQLEGVTGRVEFHEGRTLWLTRSGFREPAARYRLPAALENAFVRLGFNAVLANKGKSRLVVYYPNVPNDASRIMVYDFTWKNLTPIHEELVRRANLIKAAKASGDNSELPKCPSWMCKGCEYSKICLAV